ncbi:ABC transporter permease [Alicyclobacillus ferrooxydans]|uniref:ABC transmembrane type-1 domain-containing protein n=1 Tax=Alicyclobacillus ferrooxydans TaxID=471514 RepID=A0A0P9CG77_9BACL|nr:ABC transporter permease [Alicyclobacillus ferrooxydans]KPV44774.1 hypothetical protein AN477_05695 [Alicyclobacillus ferrooxydans]
MSVQNASAAIGGASKSQKKSRGALFWKSVRKFPMVYVGGLIVFLLVICAVFAPVLALHNPITQYQNGLHMDGTPVGPSKFFPFGADDVGRDVYSRLIYGSRVSLIVGFVATAISLLIGTTLGLISGYFGGFIDTVIMRITDTILAFPFLLFALALVTILGSSLTNVLIAIGILGWGVMARVVRGQVLSVKEFEYVQAARALGASTPRILFRVILPNILGPIIVLATLAVSQNILVEAGLSFLGVGVQPPTPSWGNMIYAGVQDYQFAPWLMVYPGVALLLAVLGFNLLGDGLRDILDPRNATH